MLLELYTIEFVLEAGQFLANTSKVKWGNLEQNLVLRKVRRDNLDRGVTWNNNNFFELSLCYKQRHIWQSTVLT